jgi:hypothetical protein
VIDEKSKVCRVEESAISASPICHQGAKPLKHQKCDYAFNYGQNFFVGSSIKCSSYIVRFFYLIDFSLHIKQHHHNTPAKI